MRKRKSDTETTAYANMATGDYQQAVDDLLFIRSHLKFKEHFGINQVKDADVSTPASRRFIERFGFHWVEALEPKSEHWFGHELAQEYRRRINNMSDPNGLEETPQNAKIWAEVIEDWSEKHEIHYEDL